MAPVGKGDCEDAPTVGELMDDVITDIGPSKLVNFEISPFRTKHKTALCEFVAMLQDAGHKVTFQGGPCNEKKLGRHMEKSLKALVELPLRQEMPGKIEEEVAMPLVKYRKLDV